MAIGILCCHNLSDYGTKVYTAYSFYSGQILQDARKEAKVTQEELARRTNTTKSYISKVENGVITPSVGVFYRFINALGLRLEVVKPIYGTYQKQPFFHLLSDDMPFL